MKDGAKETLDVNTKVEKEDIKTQNSLNNHLFEVQEILGDKMVKIETELSQLKDFSADFNMRLGVIQEGITSKSEAREKEFVQIKNLFASADKAYKNMQDNQANLTIQLEEIRSSRDSFKAEVSNAFNDVKDLLQRQQQVSTGSVSSNRSKGLPDFRTGFGNFVVGKGETEQIQSIIKEARGWQGVYNQFSLLAQVRKTLPLSIMQAAPSENNNLQDVLVALEKRYSNEADVFSLSNELFDFNFKKGNNMARQLSSFLDKVNAYNNRCADAGRESARWNCGRALEIGIEKIHLVDTALAQDILHNLDVDKMGSNFVINVGDIQTVVAKRERNFLYSRRWSELSSAKNAKSSSNSSPSKAKNTVLFGQTDAAVSRGRTEEFSWVCWKCGKNQTSINRKRVPCPCGEKPLCSIKDCSRQHKTEFHEAFLKLKSSNNSSWVRGNTQGLNKVVGKPP